eukprot:scaffold1160_cov95-Cylindrotheca_fusiformis.AAC.1
MVGTQVEESTKAMRQSFQHDDHEEDEESDKGAEAIEATEEIMKVISRKYSSLDEEDAALKKQRTDVWKSGFKSIVEVHQSPLNRPWMTPAKKRRRLCEKRTMLVETLMPTLPDHHHEDWYPEAKAMGGGSSLRTSDLIIQSGDTEDNDPSDVLINAIPVDEIEELGAPAMSQQEMVSAVVMSEDDKGARGIWSIFQNRQVACIVVLFVIISASLAAGLSRSDDTKTADDTKRASDAAPSFPPTAATSLLADLLRDSVDDAMPWENKTTPQYKALDWLTNDDVWLAESLKDGNYISIPIHVLQERYALVVLCMAWGDREWATRYARMLDETTSSCEWSIEEFCLPENDFCLPKGAVCDDDGFISGLSFCKLGGFLAHQSGGHRRDTSGTFFAIFARVPPSEWQPFTWDHSTELFQLPKLELLFLSGNKLSGSIPIEVGLAANLRHLDLDENYITGTLDNVVNPVLESLYLSANLLEGTIPQDIGTMTMLETLVLSVNQVSGSIPREIGLAANLRNLDLRQNLITGTLDNVVNPRLKNLDLSGNLLEGSIPQDIGTMTMLETLDFYNNQLSGSIPREIGLAANLRNLDLANNLLTGTLDNVVNPRLKNLDLSGNLLEGTIPQDFGIMTLLESLRLGSNKLSGPLPPTLADLHRLDSLSLEDNPSLTGAVPDTLSSLNVSNLDLEGTNQTNLEGIAIGFAENRKWMNTQVRDCTKAVGAFNMMMKRMRTTTKEQTQ